MIANSQLDIGYRLVQASAGSRLSFEFETDRFTKCSAEHVDGHAVDRSRSRGIGSSGFVAHKGMRHR
jgi:hypothetical protein